MSQINLEFNIESASLVELRNQFKELRKAMAEATDPAELSRLAAEAGEVRDKMKDLNEQVAEFAAGSDFEKVNNNIAGIKDGISNLDFGKISQSVTNLAGNIKKVDLKSLTAGVGDMTKAFGVLGKSLLTNPLFLIGSLVAVIGLILNELGLFKKLFEGIGKFAEKVKQGIEDISESLGITNKKAEEAAAARAKQLEETKKAQEEENKAVVTASKDYIELIYRLKQTNQGSAERKKAIDEINKTYGTTFKNLKDEASFQNQLNASVKEYLALQVMRIKADLNKEKLTEAVKKQIEAEKEYNKQYAIQVKNSQAYAGDMEKTAFNFSEQQTKVNAAYKELEKYNTQIESLSTSSYDLNKEIDKLTKGGEQYTKTTNSSSGAIDKQAAANKNLINDLKARTKEEEDLTQQIIKKKIDLLEAGLQKEKEARLNAYNIERAAILEKSTKDQVADAETLFADKKITEEQYLKQLSDIRLNAEANLTEKERELLTLTQEQLNRDLLKLDKDAANKRALAQLELQKASAKTLAEQKAVEIEIARETAKQAVEAEGVTEEQKIVIRREALNTIAELEEDRQSVLTAAAEKERQTAEIIAQNQVDNAKADLDAAKEGTAEKIKLLEIYRTAVTAQLEIERNARLAALDEELAKLQKRNEAAQAGTGPAISEEEIARIRQIEEQKKAIQDEFRRQKLDLDKAAEEEIDKLKEDKAAKAIKKIGEYAAGVSEAITMLSDIQNNLLEIEKTRLAEKHQQQLEGLDEESQEYKDLKKSQAKEEEDLQKKIFEINKKQQIAAATIQGVQAVLNAYASGMQLGPLAPIAGPAFAAMAAIVAATNISKIKSQQYQGGGGSGSASVGSTPDIAGMSGSAAAPIVNLFGQNNNANTETFTQPTTGGSPVISVVATVSETEITATQQRVALMNRNAEL